MTCRSDIRAVTNRGALRRRATAIALAAAFGLAASVPMAAIIDSGPITIAIPATLAGVYINWLTGGTGGSGAGLPGWDFNPYQTATGLGFYWNNAVAASSGGVGVGTTVSDLAVGAIVGPAATYSITIQGASPNFRTTGPKILGFRFQNEGTLAVNYGYALMDTTAGAGNQAGFPATITRYVYENTGLPITVAAPPPTILYAFNRANNHLVSFDASTPGTLISDIPLVGLAPSDSVLGIDFRPSTGQLYAMVDDGAAQRMVTIAVSTGAVRPVNAANSTATPAGTAFGVDFNPTVDRLREVSDADINLRLNPTTGALAATDTSLSPSPNVVHVAYSNNYPGVTTTTLYGIDSLTDSLVMIGGANGSPSPNGGVVTTIGPLGVAIGDLGGFDIHYAANVAYAALQVGGASQLYTINLATGAATLVGQIGTLTQVDGLSVAFTYPVPQSAVSRKVQGAATFDLPL